MTKMKTLCKRVYWYKHKWRFRPAAHHKPALSKMGYPTSWVPLSAKDDDALRKLTDLLDQMDRHCGLMTGMRRVFDRYEQEVVPKYAPRTQQDKIDHLKRLRRSFGHMEPDQINTAMVQSYVDRRGKSSPSQANQEASTLSQSLRYARVWGMMNGANPVHGIIRHELKARERLPTLGELVVFKSHASPFIAAYTDFKLETGLRQEDILRLTMAECFSEDGIRVRTGKTGKRLFFPWTDRLAEIVARIRSLNSVESSFLMCSPSGGKLSKNTFSGRWRASMTKALSAEENPLGERFNEHDVRATHATLVEERVGIEAASLNLGHDNLKTTKMYLRGKKYERTTPFSAVVNDRV